jgi:hypothetical protein
MSGWKLLLSLLVVLGLILHGQSSEAFVDADSSTVVASAEHQNDGHEGTLSVVHCQAGGVCTFLLAAVSLRPPLRWGVAKLTPLLIDLRPLQIVRPSYPPPRLLAQV